MQEPEEERWGYVEDKKERTQVKIVEWQNSNKICKNESLTQSRVIHDLVGNGKDYKQSQS